MIFDFHAMLYLVSYIFPIAKKILQIFLSKFFVIPNVEDFLSNVAIILHLSKLTLKLISFKNIESYL